jgi:hypothetical protein
MTVPGLYLVQISVWIFFSLPDLQNEKRTGGPSGGGCPPASLVGQVGKKYYSGIKFYEGIYQTNITVLINRKHFQ